MAQSPTSLDHWIVPAAQVRAVPYQPVYPQWNGWVRTGPDRDGDLLDKDPYSRADNAILAHPALAGASESRVAAILLLQLHGYLDFTGWVELDLVNEVNRDVAQGLVLPSLPPAARRDAVSIYGDEAAHTAFSLDLAAKLRSRRGVQPVRSKPWASAQAALAKDLAGHAPELRPYVRLFWAIASETVITANLSSVAYDNTVNPVVRAVLGDHAADEGVHYVFFTRLFQALWPNLTAAGKDALVRWYFRRPRPPRNAQRCLPQALAVDSRHVRHHR